MKKFNLAAMALVLAANVVNSGLGLAGDRHSAGMSNGSGRSAGQAGFQMPAQNRGAGFGQGAGNRVLGGANLPRTQTVPQAPAPVKTAPVTTSPGHSVPVKTAPISTAPFGTVPANPSPIKTAPPVKVTQPTGGRIGLPPLKPGRTDGQTGTATTPPSKTPGSRVIFPGLPGGRDQSGNDKRHPTRPTPGSTGTSPQGPVVVADPGRNSGGVNNPPAGPTGPGNGGGTGTGGGHGGHHNPRPGHGGCVVICPPYVFPTVPVNCLPCPPVFNDWCWFPGYGDCYGYCGGVGLPVGPVVVSTATLAVRDVVAQQSVVRIVPGTRVVASLETTGSQNGRMVLQYGDIAMNAAVESWTEGSVSFEVPALALKQPVEAQLLFLNANGELLETVTCELSAADVQQAS